MWQGQCKEERSAVAVKGHCGGGPRAVQCVWLWPWMRVQVQGRPKTELGGGVYVAMGPLFPSPLPPRVRPSPPAPHSPLTPPSHVHCHDCAP